MKSCEKNLLENSIIKNVAHPTLGRKLEHEANKEHIPNLPKFAFIGWNPFQIRHILDIAHKLPNSCILIEKRADHIFQFEDDLLTKSGVPVVIFSRNRIKELDGLFDVIICQTPFSQMNFIKQSKIAMIQYGYAKAAHNYGAWRSAADLCMVYGEAAARNIRPMCPVVVTGNSAFDKWHNPDFHEASKKLYGPSLNSSKKTLLYAPTWGELSTSNIYFKEVLSLTDNYNVIFKLHHNTDLLEKKKRGVMSANAPIIFGSNSSLLELMTVSDIVISDYSGAIFDALYCKLPVVLLHDRSEQRVGDKLTLDSLEYSARHEIGPVLEQPGNLREIIRQLIEGKLDFSKANDRMSTDLYFRGPGATENVVESLKNLGLSK
jgi:CDP-Glycerol:Poly(glycerophosphate) glycerophosphotransferase